MAQNFLPQHGGGKKLVLDIDMVLSLWVKLVKSFPLTGTRAYISNMVVS